MWRYGLSAVAMFAFTVSAGAQQSAPPAPQTPTSPEALYVIDGTIVYIQSPAQAAEVSVPAQALGFYVIDGTIVFPIVVPEPPKSSP